MGVFDGMRRVRIESDPPDPGGAVRPRVVSVARPDTVRITAFVSLAKDYIPDQVYLKSDSGSRVAEQESNVVKRYNPKRRLVAYY
ncbi:MAG: hypothetical protein WCW52_06175 [Elusimicrobiales bacterium]|jgi:hypothetical protein